MQVAPIEPSNVDNASVGNRHNRRSILWTTLLVPLLFLPYRWLWFPCGLAATLLIAQRNRSLKEIFHRDGTLIVGSLLVLLIRTALDPVWWLPWFAIVLFILWFRRQPWCSRRLATAGIILIWPVAFGLLTRPSLSLPFNPHNTSIGTDSILVCAGDSLTSGVKLGTDDDTYVACLRETLPGRVINAGVANDRTADVLARLDRDVLVHKPTVVLLFVGGNDYLGGTPRNLFADNMENAAARIVATGSKLVMVEVPTGIIWNPYAGIYRSVARRHGAILVPESRLRCWYSLELLARPYLPNPLTIDGIHLSPTGARNVAQWLEPYLRLALNAS